MSDFHLEKCILQGIKEEFLIDDEDPMVIRRRYALSNNFSYLNRYNVSLSRESFNYVFNRDSCLTILGCGAQGAVYEAAYKGNTFVFKRLKLSCIEERNSSTMEKDIRALREIDNHQRLSHPNVVRSYYHCIEFDENNTFWLNLFMEKCANGTLRNWLNCFRQNSDIDVKMRMFLDICRGLQYIHSCSLIHRDLKPENILLTENNMCKIADLGLSKFIGDKMSNSFNTRLVGTPVYASPEKITTTIYDESDDIFALGFIMMEILEDTPMNIEEKFNAMNGLREFDLNLLLKSTTHFQSIEAKVRILPAFISENYPKHGKLIIKMTEHDPKNRPDIEDIIHSVLSET